MCVTQPMSSRLRAMVRKVSAPIKIIVASAVETSAISLLLNVIVRTVTKDSWRLERGNEQPNTNLQKEYVQYAPRR